MSLKVVSNQTHTDIDRESTDRDFAGAARALAANIMRIVRGAGAAYMIPGQIHGLFDAMEAYRAVHGTYPAQWDWEQALDCELAWGELRPSTLTAGDDYASLNEGQKLAFEEKEALSDLRDGALQIAASMLLKQVPQKASGLRQLYEGFWQFREVRDKSDDYYTSLAAKGQTLQVLRDELAAAKAKKPKPKAKKAPPRPRSVT